MRRPPAAAVPTLGRPVVPRPSPPGAESPEGRHRWQLKPYSRGASGWEWMVSAWVSMEVMSPMIQGAPGLSACGGSNAVCMAPCIGLPACMTGSGALALVRLDESVMTTHGSQAGAGVQHRTGRGIAAAGSSGAALTASTWGMTLCGWAMSCTASWVWICAQQAALLSRSNPKLLPRSVCCHSCPL